MVPYTGNPPRCARDRRTGVHAGGNDRECLAAWLVDVFQRRCRGGTRISRTRVGWCPSACCGRRIRHSDRAAGGNASSCWCARLHTAVCLLLYRHWPVPTRCRHLASIPQLGMGSLRRHSDPRSWLAAVGGNALVRTVVSGFCPWSRIDIAWVVLDYVFIRSSCDWACRDRPPGSLRYFGAPRLMCCGNQ